GAVGNEANARTPQHLVPVQLRGLAAVVRLGEVPLLDQSAGAVHLAGEPAAVVLATGDGVAVLPVDPQDDGVRLVLVGAERAGNHDLVVPVGFLDAGHDPQAAAGLVVHRLRGELQVCRAHRLASTVAHGWASPLVATAPHCSHTPPSSRGSPGFGRRYL